MKRIICLLLALVLLTAAAPALAHDRDEHDEELEYVLFRDRYYSDTHPTTGKIIQRIEDASYLAIDQFNGSGTTELKNLNDDHIPGIPSSMSQIDFSSLKNYKGTRPKAFLDDFFDRWWKDNERYDGSEQVEAEIRTIVYKKFKKNAKKV